MDILTQSIGVDAAKSELVISVEAQKPFSVSNDMESLEAAKSRFPKGATVYIESSGGYERTAIRFFRDQGFKIALLNPLKARRLAQAQGVSAKTDPIDARMLARSGHLVKASAP